MTTETTSLAAWLLEQIEADEAVARANLWLDWEAARCEEDLKWWVGSPEVGDLYSTGYVGNGDSEPAAKHIARHDPARVLAQCKAHRAILELADEATGLDMQVDSEFRIGRRDEIAEPYIGDQMLYALATIYADRPGYDARRAV